MRPRRKGAGRDRRGALLYAAPALVDGRLPGGVPPRGADLQRRTLGGLVSYFTTEVGELNATVSIWEYESFEEQQRRRAALAAEPAWREYLRKIRPMISAMSNRLMNRAV
jgi:hypothetical protein